MGLLIKLGVVLNSRNLCLINYLKLLWPHIASTTSDKDIFAKLYPNSDYLFFWFRGYMTQYMLRIKADWIPSRFVWFHFHYASFSYSFENNQGVRALGELLINYMDSGISLGRFLVKKLAIYFSVLLLDQHNFKLL